MKGKLNIKLFSHSLVSDWNHGNAHFLRGLARALGQLGNKVRCYEELGAWSLKNLVENEQECSIQAIDDFRERFRDLDIHFYQLDASLEGYLEEELKDADLVIVHEWNDPKLVNLVLDFKQDYGFKALFLDTHHRAYTRAGEILRFHLHLFDGVLAFGEPIRRIYADGFGIEKAWTFHEAADIENFKPLEAEKQNDLVWIGNWGDDERTRELQEFLIEPAKAIGAKTAVHGVRYPDAALHTLNEAGIDYRGYLPNLNAPSVYAQSGVTVHIPRKAYTNGLSGIPTIRVFEALACGIPLVCAPWEDAEHLFRPGQDYLQVKTGAEMTATLKELLADPDARDQLVANGLETIRKRHTCKHRAEQLMDICSELAA
jgi:spore maturation protein CgeB